MSELIDRQAAITLPVMPKEHREYQTHNLDDVYEQGWFDLQECIENLPSVQPEIIRCKDCRWWDKYDEWDNGYCMAAKHGYWSEHWEIIIRRTYKGDFYCADAEPVEDEAEEEGEGEQE